MTKRQKLIDTLIENTTGTCQSLEHHMEGFDMEMDDLSMKELAYIDDAIFECACCGWWYDLGSICPEIEEEMVCMNCKEDWS